MESRPSPDPRLLPLAAILKARGIRIALACRMNCDTRVGRSENGRNWHRMKELNCTAPLLATHANHGDRRLIVCLGTGLEAWRERLRSRGIDLLSVSAEAAVTDPTHVADLVCERIYKVHPEDLEHLVRKGYDWRRIAEAYQLSVREVDSAIRRYSGCSITELRQRVC